MALGIGKGTESREISEWTGWGDSIFCVLKGGEEPVMDFEGFGVGAYVGSW